MQTMCWVNKLGRFLAIVVLVAWAIEPAIASTDIYLAKKVDGHVLLQMTDGADYDLTLRSDVVGAFYSKDKHLVEGEAYISLFQVSPSNSVNPVGLCGAGNEIWLYVYQVAGTSLIEKTKQLVSSCLRSISMSSQNSGKVNQDGDFSSVKWNSHGFSIEWFDNVDFAGRPLQLSNFISREGGFFRQDVLIQDTSKK